MGSRSNPHWEHRIYHQCCARAGPIEVWGASEVQLELIKTTRGNKAEYADLNCPAASILDELVRQMQTSHVKPIEGMKHYVGDFER
ncbi:hypothetical protein PQX77_006005 [Marasmius sp. AFHP31]|nr:hypothetical protein PQX77_006005 [Marasmius sp. AFHP31]